MKLVNEQKIGGSLNSIIYIRSVCAREWVCLGQFLGHKCTMIKMEEPPPPPSLSPSSPLPSPPSSFDQFRIRRRGLSNSTLTCLSVVIAVAVIIACFLPIHPVNAGSCKEPKEGVEINETLLIGMLNTHSFTLSHKMNLRKTAQQNKTFVAAAPLLLGTINFKHA